MIKSTEQQANRNVPGYLGRDLSQHRVHTTKYEDLCKQCFYDGAELGSTAVEKIVRD